MKDYDSFSDFLAANLNANTEVCGSLALEMHQYDI